MKRIFLIVALSIVASGCTSPPKQSFNKELNKDVKSVTLLNAPHIKKVKVGMVHHPGASFGLVGGALAALDQHAKTVGYNNAIKSKATDWNNYAEQQIKTQLEKNGFKVALLNARKKDDTSREYLEKYPEVSDDAILDYHFSVAHVATGPTTPYIPTVLLYTRMTKTKDKSVIYEEQYSVGNAAVGRKSVQLGAGSNNYKDSPALNSNPEASVSELKSAIQRIAQRIGEDLR